MKAGSRKCDLCQHTFQFAPRYAPDAPETLSKLEVGMELCLKLAHHWIPFVIRLVFVCFIWLGVMPLCTAYIYQGWMHRPSSVIGRMTWNMMGSDLVNGCLLTVINVVGFLSIMSLIDFFRLQWDKLDTITTKKEEEEHNEDDVLIQADTIEDDYMDKLQELSLRFNKRVRTRKISRIKGGLPYGVVYKHETQDPFATMFHQDDQSATKLWNARQNTGQSDKEDKPKGNAYEEDDDDDDDDDDYEDEEEDETDDESAIERMMQLQEEDDSESNSDSDDSIQNNDRLELREEIRAMEANIANIQQMIAEENRVNANVADERMVSL